MTPEASTWQALADAVLLLHFGVVLFVVAGLVYIVLGGWRGWPGATRPGFRLAHVAAIAVVVLQAWLGRVCPLTTLESWLREQAGQAGYRASFVEHWVQRLLFHEAPGWVFALAYTAFAALVLAAWWRFPPRWRRR